jgi:hypothetical protein
VVQLILSRKKLLSTILQCRQGKLDPPRSANVLRRKGELV